jgi:membrane-associated phospholipid phosphatase
MRNGILGSQNDGLAAMKKTVIRNTERTVRMGIPMKRELLARVFLVVIIGSSPCGAPGLFAQNVALQDTAEQKPALRDSVERNKYNFCQFATETWGFVKQPTQWDGGDWLRVGLFGGGTILLMQVDQQIRDAVTKDQRYFRTVPMEAGRLWAETYPPVLFFTGFAVHAWLTSDVASKKIAFEIAQAMLYSGGVRMLSGAAIGRARPYSNEGPKSFHPFSRHTPSQDYQSIPGGHCVIGFALSTVLSRNAGPMWLKVLAYVPAGLTFVSRVYQDRHWTSDDFIGASLGYFVATWVVDQHEQGESRVHVSSVFPLTIGITLN